MITKGKWEIEPFDNSDKEIRIKGMGIFIDNDDVCHDESRAIAQAISAVPDMIEALQELVIGDDAGLHETEYDGRMYTVCQYCNYQDDVRPEHQAGCAILIGRAALEKAIGTQDINGVGIESVERKI